jgi:glycosyltransferase 2 family protein
MERRIKTGIKGLLTILAIYMLFQYVGVDRFALIFRRVEWIWFLIAWSCSPIVVLISSRKWYEMVHSEAKGLTYGEAVRAFLGGTFFGLFTPGRLGEFGKIALIRQGRLPILSGIALLDRMVDVEVLLIMATVGVSVIYGPLVFGATVGVALLGACIILSGRLKETLLRPILLMSPFKDKVAGFMDGFVLVPAKTLCKCAGLRLGACTIDLLQFFLIVNSFDSVQFVHVAAVYPLIILTNLFPLTVGGIGVREAMSMYTLSYFGVNPETAVSASFLLFAINTFMPGMAGAAVVARYGISMRTGNEALSLRATQVIQ